jgi:hypothetical protein
MVSAVSRGARQWPGIRQIFNIVVETQRDEVAEGEMTASLLLGTV